MKSERKSKLRNQKGNSCNEEKARAIIVDAIAQGVRRMSHVRGLKGVLVETLEVDHWGKRKVYSAKGYVNVLLRTRFFRTKQGEKRFNAVLDAKNMEMRFVDWEPGKIVDRSLDNSESPMEFIFEG